MTVPKIQELVKQGRGETDLEKRRKVYQELYRTAHDEATWLFVHAQDELWAKRRDVAWCPHAITGSKAIVYYFQVPGAR
jgi:ABC-type transport system substrate-binding protein